MNVLLTVDVEIWCRSWSTLDEDFVDCFARYVYGQSSYGEFALPKTLEVLARHGLKAVFFVEPLFAARFGIEPLAEIVALISAAGQEIQLHLHPEWTDEARPPLLPPVGKRQHLYHYTREEQTQLIGHGLRLLCEAGAPPIKAFRAGSFASNADTFSAVRANGLRFDSSLNTIMPQSGPDLRDRQFLAPFEREGVLEYPMGVFRDGLGQLRHAQLGACSATELCHALMAARTCGWREFVLLSHNDELLLSGGRRGPDPLVVRRFETLARFLSDHREIMPTVGFNDLPGTISGLPLELPAVGLLATVRRHGEQAWRRLRIPYERP